MSKWYPPRQQHRVVGDEIKIYYCVEYEFPPEADLPVSAEFFFLYYTDALAFYEENLDVEVVHIDDE